MGPAKVAKKFLDKHPDVESFRVFLYGSLAATGKGHLTDVAICEVFSNKKIELIWDPETLLPKHPNALKFGSLDRNGQPTDSWTVYSIGGGAIIDDHTELADKTINLFGKDFATSGALHEYYEPETGEPLLNKGFQNWNYLVTNMIAWKEKRKVVEEF